MGDGGIAPLLELAGISKRFGGISALTDVHLAVQAGEVHGLLGENGSGKSTLIKVLAGYHTPEPGGELRLNGSRIPLPLAPGDPQRFGITFVHQDLGLEPELSVLENLLMVRLATHSQARIRWRQEEESARSVFENYGIDIHPRDTVRTLRESDRALLAIVRAAEGIKVRPESQKGVVCGSTRVLVLDEPTVYLSGPALEKLVGIMRGVTDVGGSVVFVSHDLDEVLQFTDRSTVLRDGRVRATVSSTTTTKAQLIELIVGRAVTVGSLRRAVEPSRAGASEATEPERSAAPSHGSETRHVIADLSGGDRKLERVTFALERGEILGFTGLLGSGFEDIPYLIFGAKSPESGVLRYKDQEIALRGLSPSAAIKFGLALIPADRKADGAMFGLSVEDNLLFQRLHSYQRWWGLDRRRMRRDATRILDEYGVRCDGSAAMYQTLSGGNQQKVLLGKWLQTKPHLLLLHEPTQGVDVGAREELFQRLRNLSAEGMSLICASSDHDQLAAICARVLVMRAGVIVSELSGRSLTKEAITAECLAA